MDTRKFLDEARRLPAEIDAAKERIERLRAERDGLSSPSFSRPRTGRRDGLDAIVAKIDTEKRRWQRKYNKLLETRVKAERLIRLLPDPRQRAILTDYYLNGLTWEEVEKKTHYSEQHARRLRDKAIDTLAHLRCVKEERT